MSAVTMHVLDAALGRPAAGIAVLLEGPELCARGTTDADGRIGDLGPERLPAGDYRLTFETGAYFAERGVDTFYPLVQITFRIADPAQHHHVPLLLSPFAYSTYRGS
ncbi:hydroxyisourate hydrolase [Saccharopolyspora sp. MS10]|uniref:hydroxyisourate hydrolase n=1 Tax=Saccharopolyspora sp. MS10 TaxID=3385973 RepID=UPI0039A29D3B